MIIVYFSDWNSHSRIHLSINLKSFSTTRLVTDVNLYTVHFVSDEQRHKNEACWYKKPKPQHIKV